MYVCCVTGLRKPCHRPILETFTLTEREVVLCAQQEEQASVVPGAEGASQVYLKGAHAKVEGACSFVGPKPPYDERSHKS